MKNLAVLTKGKGHHVFAIDIVFVAEKLFFDFF